MKILASIDDLANASFTVSYQYENQTEFSTFLLKLKFTIFKPHLILKFCSLGYAYKYNETDPNVLPRKLANHMIEHQVELSCWVTPSVQLTRPNGKENISEELIIIYDYFLKQRK